MCLMGVELVSSLIDLLHLFPSVLPQKYIASIIYMCLKLIIMNPN